MTNYRIIDLQWVGGMASFELNGLLYKLFREQVTDLRDTGVLYGINRYEPYGCHRCHTPLFERKRACPHCGVDEWAEFTLLYCRFCFALFELDSKLSGRIPPWKAIPYCPACRHEHWCRAEDKYFNPPTIQAPTKVKSPEELAYEKKIDASERDIRLAPNNANAYYNKGCALNALKRYEDAIYAFGQAIRLAPNNANAY